MNVSPARFEGKAQWSSLRYGINLETYLPTNVTVTDVNWRSEPPGLQLSAPLIAGPLIDVLVAGGAKGQTYRVIAEFTLSNGERDSADVNDQQGVPLQIFGEVINSLPAYRVA